MRRHLIYHCYPRRARLELLQWHAEQLRQRQSVFDGRRLLTFALDETTLSPLECRALFGSGYEFSFVANDSDRWEMTSLRHQLLTVRDLGGMIFRAHAKGVTYEPGNVRGQSAQQWAECMYASLLDDMEQVEQVMASHETAGIFLQDGPCFKWLGRIDWHYSGSYYWLRADVVQRGWGRLWDHAGHNNNCFVEALPTILCCRERAACLSGQNPGDLYELSVSSSHLQAVRRRRHLKAIDDTDLDQLRGVGCC